MFKIFIHFIMAYFALGQLDQIYAINFGVPINHAIFVRYLQHRIPTSIYLYKLNTTQVPAGTKFLNFYYTPIFNTTDVLKIVFSYIYMYVSDTQVPTDAPLPVSQLINNSKHIDFGSYIYDLPQLVSINFQALASIPPIYYVYIAMVDVSVYSFNTIMFAYQLTINASSTQPCPMDCNGGNCVNGICTQCLTGNYGHNCYLNSIELGMGPSNNYILHQFNYSLFSIPTNLIESGLNIDLTFTNFQDDAATNGVLILNESNIQACTLIYPYNCQISNFTAINPSTTISIYSNQRVFILIFNYFYKTSTVQFNLWKIGASNSKLLIIIGASCGGGIALIMIIIYLVRRSRERVIPKQQDVKPLTKIELDLYFPAVRYQNLEKELESEDKDELIHIRNCVICINDIKKEDLVRITYCCHIFHRQCLSNWFLKQLSCPYCRAPFDRKNLNDYLTNLKQEYNQRNQTNIKQLKELELAMEILYRAKLDKEQKMVQIQLQKQIRQQNQKQLKGLNIDKTINEHSRDQNSQMRIQVLE